MKLFNNKPGIDHVLGLPIAYEVSAGAVVFRRESDSTRRFLLLQYRHRHWDFAKGHVELGETLEEAARRETEEETGLTRLRLVAPFHRRVHFFYTAKGSERKRRLQEGRALWIFKTVHFFLAESMDSTSVRLSDEHLDFAWLPFETAVERATFENAKELLRLAQRILSR
ncbi:MAG: NUDIX domain-containing protein [Candidatus Moraniibacteriota bacterium]|nr:MAG: NUDIX domain-containing protein [Candidatus Moranbacteria bacterium]